MKLSITFLIFTLILTACSSYDATPVNSTVSENDPLIRIGFSKKVESSGISIIEDTETGCQYLIFLIYIKQQCILG
ncbi:hypothetical protein PCURB6_26580 [Paenibacillus curdlanolyticus]|nr:hypothetical protein PCURB6_26580 [Paenibacillus curdlanolyticus]